MGGACLRPPTATEAPQVEKQEALESDDETSLQLPPLPSLDNPSETPGAHGALKTVSNLEQNRDVPVLENSLGSMSDSASGALAQELTAVSSLPSRLTEEISVVEKGEVESGKWKSSGWSNSSEVKTLAPALGETCGMDVINGPLEDSLESLTQRTWQEEKEGTDKDKKEEADQDKYKPSPCASPSALKNLRSFLEEVQTPNVSDDNFDSSNPFASLTPKTLCSEKEDSGEACLNVTLASLASVTTNGACQRQIPANACVSQCERLGSQDRRNIFDRSKRIGGKPGAEALHSKLPPLYWGVSQCQLRDFLSQVKVAGVENRTPAHFKPYDQCRFEAAGPNMHQVNEQFIKACTNDNAKPIPWVSYALQQNHEKGLECNLYVSHAWDEGTYEFCDTVLGAWPDGCTGAYICSLANPQNLNIGELIGAPSQSPFYRVLACCPQDMLVVSNSNTPVYARLWCCYEAYCALQINQSLVPKQADGSRKDVLELSDESAICIKIVGNPLHLISAENCGQLRAKAVTLMQDLRLHEKKSMAGRVADLSFSVESSRAQLLQLVMQIDLDINNAQCSLEHDARSIWKDIGDGKDRVNLMIKQHLYYAFARSMDQQSHG